MPTADVLSLSGLVEFYRLMPKILLPGYLGAESLAIGTYWLADRLDRFRVAATEGVSPLSRTEYSLALHNLRRTCLNRALMIAMLLEFSEALFVILLALTGILNLAQNAVPALLTITMISILLIGPPAVAVYLLQRSNIRRRYRRN